MRKKAFAHLNTEEEAGCKVFDAKNTRRVVVLLLQFNSKMTMMTVMNDG